MTIHITSQELLSYAVRCGLTVADLKKFSIGFIIDYIFTYSNVKNNIDIHAEEEKYLKFKSILPFVDERLKKGEISQRQYNEFMDDYKMLEDKYGTFNY